jgi:hypothetical protein
MIKEKNEMKIAKWKLPFINYLETILDKELTKTEQDKLSDMIGFNRHGVPIYASFGMIDAYFEECKIPYVVYNESGVWKVKQK